MKNLINKFKRCALPFVLAGEILVGCASTTQELYNPYNILDETEAKTTLIKLKEIEPEYKKLEKEFYDLMSQKETDTEYFQELQIKYHELKAEKEKYQRILKLNQKKK